MKWVKELKIKYVDGVLIRTAANNCRIINLDSNNGPGTHWVCYVDSFYSDPFGLPSPKIFFLSNDTILHNIKKYIRSLWLLLYFFIKKFQDGNSVYNILYKILDPINPSKNETNLKDYFIYYGNV